MKRLKIAHLINSLSIGGAEVFVQDLSLEQSKENHVEIWSMFPPLDPVIGKEMKDVLNAQNITCRIIGETPNKNRIQRIKQIRNYIYKFQPDVLNCHSEVGVALSIIASLGLKTKLVETIHSTVLEFEKLHKNFIRYKVDKFVAISLKCRDIIENRLKVPPENIELIYNGINIEKFRASDRVINKTADSVVIIGRLESVKDHSSLFDAFNLLIKKLENANIKIPTLYIIGDGTIKNELEIKVRNLNLENYIKFLGSRSDIPDILLKSDCFVLPSKWEGLSIALLEAIASGIPVVATNVGSNYEIIEDGKNGFLVDKENPAQFADALFKVLSNSELRRKFSSYSRDKVNEFNIKHTSEKYISMYQNVKNG